jgi:hypothetical protein
MGARCMELCLQYPIRLHGMMLRHMDNFTFNVLYVQNNTEDAFRGSVINTHEDKLLCIKACQKFLIVVYFVTKRDYPRGMC